MAGRIRSIKPELIEDEVTGTLSDRDFRLFVSLLLLADDHGGFRANPNQIGGAAFWGNPLPVDAVASLETLASVRLVVLYRVGGQPYGLIRSWKKHQRVDKPSKPRVPRLEDHPEAVEFTHFDPPPSDGSPEPSRDSRETLAPDLRSPISDLRSPTTDHVPVPDTLAGPAPATPLSPPPPASGARARKAKRGPDPAKLVPLPADWDPTAWVYEHAIDHCELEPDEVDLVVAQLRDDAAAKALRYADWDAHLRTRLRNHRKWHPNLPKATRADLFTRVKPPPVPPTRPDVEAALREGTAHYLKRIEAGERMPTAQEAAERTAKKLTGTDEAGE